MAVETADDLAAMFNVDEFAVAATHTNAYGVSTSVNGIFDNSYFAADTAIGSVAFAESSPTFTGRTADFPNIEYGDQLDIGEVTWIIREIMPDSTGVTKLNLERQ